MEEDNKVKVNYNITLRKELYIFFYDRFNGSKKSGEKFGSTYINNILGDVSELFRKYSDRDILKKLSDDNELINEILKLTKDPKLEDEVIRRYIKRGLIQLIDRLKSIKNNDGSEINKDELNILLESSFETYTSLYFGSTVLAPSQYAIYLPDHLLYHKPAIINRTIKKSIRLIILSEEALLKDYCDFPDEFGAYMKWHEDIIKQVNKDGEPEYELELLQVDPSVINEILSSPGIDAISRTISFWQSENCIIFRYKDIYEGKKSVKYYKIGAQFSNYKESQYKSVSKFVDKFLEYRRKYPKKIKNMSDIYEEFRSKMKIQTTWTDELLTAWPEIVSCIDRIKNTIPFIKARVSSVYGKESFIKTLRILDASAGLSCEVFDLKLSGFNNVTYNEPDPQLFKKFIGQIEKEKKWTIECKDIDRIPSIKYKNNEDLRINLYNLPWNYLKHIFSGEKQFNIILTLGNFISHIDKIDELETYFKYLKDLLKPGGIILFDHRNFYKIEQNIDLGVEECRKVRIDEFKKMKNKGAYCSNIKFGIPRKKLKNGKIEFIFIDINYPDKNIYSFPNDDDISCVQMFPISIYSVCKILFSVDFEKITISKDYETNKNYSIEINRTDFHSMEHTINNFEQSMDTEYFSYMAELK